MKTKIPTISPVTETAAITLLYYVTAKLGFLLAIPPGNVTPIWPPSAIALAAALLLGYRAGIGVWLGSLLVNLATMSGDTGLWAAASIATGSTLQMGLGAWCLKRWVADVFSDRNDRPVVIPTAPRGIARFAALTALSCVTAASIGAASLCSLGFAPWGQFSTLWWTWWVGDYAGILILTPSLFVVAQRFQKRPVTEPILFPLTAACFGIGIIAAVIIWQVKVHQRAEKLSVVAYNVVDQIRGAIADTIGNLGALQGLFAASDKVTRLEFKAFASRLLKLNSTTSALSWRPRIKASEVTAYIAAARKDGVNFSIFELDEQGKRTPAAPRPEYFPIYFNESAAPQVSLLGYDVSSDPMRVSALAKARDSGEVVATSPTRRVGENSAQKNILLQKAIYRQGVLPSLIEDRRENLMGFVQSVLRMDELVKHVLASPAYQNLELYLFDTMVAGRPQLIVAHRPSAQNLPANAPQEAIQALPDLQQTKHQEISFDVGGRPWLALVRPRLFANPIWDAEIWIVLISGIAISGLLLVYLNQRQHSEEELKRAESHYRELFNSAPAMYVITQPREGEALIADCNRAFLATLGYARQDVVGQSLGNFHTSSSRRRLFAHGAYGQALHGQTVEGERELVTKSGAVIPVILRAEPYRDDEGEVIGTRAMYVDITERKRAEEEFRLVVESAPNGMLMVDAQGKIRLVNRQIEQQFLYDRAELLDAPIERIVPSYQTDVSLPSDSACEMIGRRKDGSEFPVEVGLNPIQIAGDNRVLASIVDISERKRTENALHQSEMTTNMIIDSAPDAIVAVDESGKILRVSKQTEEIFGYPRDELLGSSIETLIPERFRGAHRQHRVDWQAHPQARRMGSKFEFFGLHKDGSEFPVDIMLSSLDVGGTRLLMAIVRDIRERKAAEKAIGELTSTLEQRVVARTAELEHEIAERKNVEKALTDAYSQLEHSVTALEKRNQEVTLLSEMIQLVECCQDAHEAYPVISRHLSRLFPAYGGELYMISSSQDLAECVARWGAPSPASMSSVFAQKECWALRRGRAHKVESPLRDMLCPHVELGDELPAAYVCMPLIAHSETLGILHIKFGATSENGPATHDERLMQSVVEQLSLVLGNLRLRDKLNQQSIHDPLTGLFNRRYMEEAFNRDLQRAKRSGSPLTAAMVDVDHFKRFNDTFGHAAGDLVLSEVAKLLKSKMRGSDVVCRYGGEEFVIISPEMTLEVARQKMDRLREDLHQVSIAFQNRLIDTPTISIGLAAFPAHGADGSTLLQAADAALYRAKESGRNRVMVAGEPAQSNNETGASHMV